MGLGMKPMSALWKSSSNAPSKGLFILKSSKNGALCTLSALGGGNDGGRGVLVKALGLPMVNVE